MNVVIYVNVYYGMFTVYLCMLLVAGVPHREYIDRNKEENSFFTHALLHGPFSKALPGRLGHTAN